MPKRTISKAANEAGVGVETVRFYERSGVLVKPSAPEQGWRHYPESAVWVIRYIKNAQALGFSLADCRKVLASNARPPAFCRNVRTLAEGKLEELDSEIRRLQGIRREIKQFLARCAKSEAKGACPIYDHVASAMAEKRKTGR